MIVRDTSWQDRFVAGQSCHVTRVDNYVTYPPLAIHSGVASRPTAAAQRLGVPCETGLTTIGFGLGLGPHHQHQSSRLYVLFDLNLTSVTPLWICSNSLRPSTNLNSGLNRRGGQRWIDWHRLSRNLIFHPR